MKSDTADVRSVLKAHLHGMAAPFLFVGAGISRRYVDADDWEGLLRHFAAFTSQPYDYYRTSAAGDLPTVASKIVREFHEVWWSDSRFEASRALWGDRAKQTASALKVEIALRLAEVPDRLPLKGALADELALLRGAVIDGIITTNFDPVLENLFPDFRVFVGQDDVLFANPQGIGEIYKIHGSNVDPDSLVLTAEDYERFESRNAYLAAKLMTIFVEHPVIFVGYSLQDRNVISILRSIAKCLTQTNIDELRDRLIFVQWEPESVATVGPHTIIIDDFVINVLRVVVPDFLDVFAALASLRRSFSAKLLRRLKEHVYELVLEDDPHSRLVVADIDDDTVASDIDVVFGVGVQARLGQHGYVGLDRWDLVDDVIEDGQQYDGASIVNDTLPRLLAGSANAPVFKYLRQADLLDRRGTTKKSAQVPARVLTMAEKTQGGLQASAFYANKAPAVLAGVTTIDQLLAKEGLDGVLNYAFHMRVTKKLAEELRQFLDSHRELRTGSTKSTQYVKLVCFYDWLAYGRQL